MKFDQTNFGIWAIHFFVYWPCFVTFREFKKAPLGSGNCRNSVDFFSIFDAGVSAGEYPPKINICHSLGNVNTAQCDIKLKPKNLKKWTWVNNFLSLRNLINSELYIQILNQKYIWKAENLLFLMQLLRRRIKVITVSVISTACEAV